MSENWLKHIHAVREVLRVTMETNDTRQIAAFEAVAGKFREIKLAHRLAGQASFILFIGVIDQKSYEEFLIRLNKIPGVKKIDHPFMQMGFKTFAAYGCGTENPITRFEVNGYKTNQELLN
jgi:hypothetical protein